MTTTAGRARTVSLLTVLMLVALAQPAFAVWSTPGSGIASSFATSVDEAAAPAVQVASQVATLTWDAAVLAGTSVTATGYLVERVWRGDTAGPQGQTNGDSEPATGGCAGTIAATTCATAHASGETWAYRLTPIYGTWTGTKGPESQAVTAASAPTVTSLVLVNVGTLGTVNAGDRIEITFSEVLDADTVCSGFSASETGPQTATGMTFDFAGNPNVITITNGGTCGTSGFGSLQVGGTGNDRYTQGGQSLTTPSSTLTWNPANRTITVTFGSVSGSTTSGSSATVVLTPGALTASGLPIAATPVDSATPQRF
jgi:hypothetical protein